ncbi:hypothetical protein [Weissella minor]|uniref:Lactococcin 972 family bacteriocin n=1 Tax=Weissella minor TaxID=1620 RepID=A0A0R2JF82_9LACO|nr:hypothetical protein [Weissella minor]KRN76016.1 hypothetical protein IV67_GL001066 [Weissella minor]
MTTIGGMHLATEVVTPMIAEAASASPVFKGKRISWSYGRIKGTYSYSAVQTGYFQHAATANQTFSGWKRKGVPAYAQQYVGLRRATAYWACK